MKELFFALEKTLEPVYLLDTCFFVYLFKNNKQFSKLEKTCDANIVAMTSFNILEFLHIHRKFDGTFNHKVRNFLKEKKLKVLEITPVPGDVESELSYINSFDKNINTIIKDHSDAVLFVAALKTDATLLTRDKHHIFNMASVNYQGAKILNDFK